MPARSGVFSLRRTPAQRGAERRGPSSEVTLFKYFKRKEDLCLAIAPWRIL